MTNPSPHELARCKVLCDILFGAADEAAYERLTGRTLGGFLLCVIGLRGEEPALPEALAAIAALPQCRGAAVFAVSPGRIAVLEETGDGPKARARSGRLAGMLPAVLPAPGRSAAVRAETVRGSGAVELRACYLDCDRALAAAFASPPAGATPRGVKPVLAKALGYIAANFGEPLSLDDVAEHAFASPCYVSRLFMRELGMGFVDYITSFRMEHAKRLLRGTDLKVFEVAERAGVPDAHYFAKLFKKSTGLSPTEYRAKQDL
jgi:AraC-like DNA-binding protein